MVQKIMMLYPEVNILQVEIYKEMGIDLILNYLININVKVKKTEVETKYSSALLKLICNMIECSKTNNIKQMSQGSKSVTYAKTEGFIIGDDIKSLLPLPRVKMMG